LTVSLPRFPKSLPQAPMTPERNRLDSGVARKPADMVDHLAVSLLAWVVPELTICVARAAFQLALMPVD
jgi:hypothetical protein